MFSVCITGVTCITCAFDVLGEHTQSSVKKLFGSMQKLSSLARTYPASPGAIISLSVCTLTLKKSGFEAMRSKEGGSSNKAMARALPSLSSQRIIEKETLYSFSH